MTDETERVLQAHGLVKHFAARGRSSTGRRHVVHAIDGVDLDIERGTTHALVGESGCGKSTVARLLLRLEAPTAGSIELLGRDLLKAGGAELRSLRRSIQIVFQDPYASLNPRMTVGAIVGEPLRVYRLGSITERRDRTVDLLRSVGLSETDASAYPHELSGGQRQRVAIARAIALDPAVVVCDEPVSSLDVSIQAQVLALLRELQETLGLAYLFISHDLAVVNQVAQRVSVMYLGKIVENGTRNEVLRDSAHPYTRALLSAHPTRTNKDTSNPATARGEPPSATEPPSGCRFRTRCWKATTVCATEEPPLRLISESHAVACHFPEIPTDH